MPLDLPQAHAQTVHPACNRVAPAAHAWHGHGRVGHARELGIQPLPRSFLGLGRPKPHPWHALGRAGHANELSWLGPSPNMAMPLDDPSPDHGDSLDGAGTPSGSDSSDGPLPHREVIPRTAYGLGRANGSCVPHHTSRAAGDKKLAGAKKSVICIMDKPPTHKKCFLGWANRLGRADG